MKLTTARLDLAKQVFSLYGVDEKGKAVLRKREQIPGIGPITATALVASVADAKLFKNGRQFAAWLGLVPRQYSTGGKVRLGRITKRGDVYLRTLLFHGTRAVLSSSRERSDRLSRWVEALPARRATREAAVALAAKNARIAWVFLARGEDYAHAARQAKACAPG